MASKSVEKKNERVSKAQKDKLVNYMGTHLEFARGQFGGLNSNMSHKEEWEALKSTLNSMGGSEKNIDQWKKCWLDLKRGVKKHVNERRGFMNRTGGGSYRDIPRDLNAFEEEILKIISVDAVDGDSSTPESGVMIEEFLDESMLSIEILEDENIPPPAKKKKEPLPTTSSTTTTASKYNEALRESRQMHAEMMTKMTKIEKQNDEILKMFRMNNQKSCDKYNSP